MKCKSGKHEWTDPKDAVKCCNGWHRELRVGTSSVFRNGWYAHIWAKDEPENTGTVSTRAQKPGDSE